MARNTSSSSSLEALDTLFASETLHEQESPIVTGRSSVASRARQTFSTIEPLEERIVQTVDTVMGPLQSPEMVRTPEEQQEIDSLNDQIQAARMELSELDPQLEEAAQALHDADATLGADHSLVLTQTSLLTSALASRTLAEQHLLEATTANNTAQSNLQLGLDQLNRDIQRMQVAKAALDKANAALASAGSKIARMLAQQVVNECNNEYKNRLGYVNDDNTTHLPPLRAAATSSKSALEKAQNDLIKAKADVTLFQNALDLATAKEQADTLTRNAAQDAFTLVDNQRADAQKRLDDLLQELADLDAFFTEQHSQQVDSTVEPDNTELAAALALSVQSTLDAEANQIKYAKMFVSMEQQENSVIFHVQHRVPNAHWIVEAKISNGDGSYDYRSNGGSNAPLSEGTWSFALNRQANSWGRSIEFQLRDLDTGAVLARANGSYDPYGNGGHIDTIQADFAIDEPGMLSENPITPSLKVGNISGPTLLLVTQTPHDQYMIYSDLSGLLSTAVMESPGGTSFGLSQITINTDKPTGDYLIQLLDRVGGQVIDTVVVHFDHNSRTLSLIESADQYTGSLEETDLGKKQQAMRALQDVPLQLSNTAISHIQQLSLYQSSQTLPAPYNLYIDAQTMLQHLYAQPQNWRFAPENQDAAVQQLWDSMGTVTQADGTVRHLTTYTQAQDSIMRGRQELVRNYMDLLGQYEQGMGECMQASVNIFLGILQGKPEGTLHGTFDTLYDTWSQKGIMNMLRNIGINFPTKAALLQSAHQVFLAQWEYLVQTQADVIQAQEREEYFLSLGLRKTAEGEWAAVTIDAQGHLLTGLDTYGVKFASKIAQVMKNSGQIMQKYTGAEQARIAAEIAGILGPNATQEDILNALQSTLSNFDTQKRDIGGANVSPEQNTAATKVLGMSQGAIFSEAFSWFNPQVSALSATMPIRQDSIMGKIIAGAADRIWMEPNMEKKYEIMYELNRITDIPVQRLVNDFMQSNTTADYVRHMTQLIVDAQYGDILSNGIPRLNPAFLSAKPDLPVYDGSKGVRIRFDIANTGKELQRVIAMIDGRQVAVMRGSGYITIPFSSFYKSQSGVRVELRAIFTDGSEAQTFSDPFDIAPNHVQTPTGTILHLSMTDNAIENAILTQVANNFPLNNPSQWHQTFGSTLHNEHAYNAVDLNMDIQDAGEIIRVVADGIIIGIGQYGVNHDGASHVDVLHTSTVMINGQATQQQWISKYLHMPMQKQVDANGNEIFVMSYNGGSVTLSLNMHLTTKDIIGGVGDIGSQGSFHSHQEFIKGNDPSGVAIDMGKTLDFLNIDAKAFIPGVGERELAWENSEWIYEDKALVYRRNLDGSEHFFANIAERNEVIWIKTEFIDENNAYQNKETWVMNSDRLKRWNPTLLKFVPTIPQ